MKFGLVFALISLVIAGASTAGKAELSYDKSCGSASQRYDVEFSGKVVAGQTYRKQLSKNYVFGLSPLTDGWFVDVFYRGRQVLMPTPLHADAVPYEIEGWHFRNSDNTGPDELGPKNVNAPQRKRNLWYSIQCASSGLPLCSSEQDLLAIKGTANCLTFTVDNMELGDLVPNEKADIKKMTFTVKFAYAAGYPH